MSGVDIPAWASRDQVALPIVASTWRRSSACESAACVEVRAGGEGGNLVLVRRSATPEQASPVLYFDRGEWAAFLAGVRNGDFDDI